MKVNCYGSEFDVPDLLIDQFLRDFEPLQGSKHREGVYQLRNAIADILNVVVEEPLILHEYDYHVDFIRALAMRQAMGQLGILHDA
jgi:hypothetical protein